MAELILLHSADPGALFAHAAAPFCARGVGTDRLPLLAVRQGGVRDQFHECAARSGAPGWLGSPLVVFAELPALLAGDLAPLTAFERRATLEQLLDRVPFRRLAGAHRHRGFLVAVDQLFGDLTAERVAPALLASGGGVESRDPWEIARDEELATLYASYLDALRALPAIDGIARSDGRDGRTLAAEAVRARPETVRARLRRPFGVPDEPVTVAIYGLNDLRRGWDHLLVALRSASFVDEVRVYLPLGEVQGAVGAADRELMEAMGEHELLDQLLERRPERVVRVESHLTPSALAPLRRTLFRAGAASAPHTPATPVHALAAPDMARELEAVARRVKRLIVEDGVAPHMIAVVSRRSRPYGPRVVEQMGRHGVPVSARLRTKMSEVPAVAALLRVFRAAAGGFTWRALGELAESPYFGIDLDVGLLKRASTRGRYASLAGWTDALERMAQEAAYVAGNDDYRGPDAERVGRAVASFAAFRAVAEQFTAGRTRGEWIALALRCLGHPRGEAGAGFDGGLWGLCRRACQAPHDETDALDVEATRRDAESIPALTGLLVEWRAALPLRDVGADRGATERLSPRAWHAELVDALGDVEITLSTPHRRGVQVLEASAAVWQSFDHLFVVGMSAGEFPAEPPGRELFAEHEREALYGAGLPLEPARVWFAREASLLRSLVIGTRASLHVSYAYVDASGAAQIPSAYFDEIASRYVSDDPDNPERWVEKLPGSLVAPSTLGDVWCTGDLELFAARRWADDEPDRRMDAAVALAQLVADPERRSLVRRVLTAAGVEHERRTLRPALPAGPGNVLAPWNGQVTSPDLVAALAGRFGDTTWSASQLELYGRCPFAFFATYVLGVRGLDEPDEDMDGAARGELLHVCLARLHGALANTLPNDALTSLAVAHAERLIPAIVGRTLDEFEHTGRGGVPALRGYRERELASVVTAYLQWEVDENEKVSRRTGPPRRRPVLFELTFGMDGKPPVTLQSGGRTLKLRGKIDRVDELTDDAVRGWRYIVDHKTSDASLTPLDLYEAGALLQMPLYMRALDQLTGDRGRGVWGGAYQIVKDECKRGAPLHPRSLQKGGRIREGGTDTEQTAASRIHDVVDLALGHTAAIQRGQFPARVPSCAKHCAPFCEARDVCREDRINRAGSKR